MAFYAKCNIRVYATFLCFLATVDVKHLHIEAFAQNLVLHELILFKCSVQLFSIRIYFFEKK